MKPKQFILIIIIIFFFFSVANADIIGKVVSVADGDTITVLRDNTQHRIRLYGIDCPESHQDFGRKAKQFASDLVFSKMVRTCRRISIGMDELLESFMLAAST